MQTTRDWTQHILLRSLCSKQRDKINKEIIGELRPEWFTTERYKSALQLVKNHYVETGNFITWKVLLKSPKLGEKVAKYIRTKEVKRLSLVKTDKSLSLPSNPEEYRDFFARTQHDARHISIVELSNRLSEELNEDMSEDEIEKLLDLVQDTTTFCNTLKTNHGELFKVNKENVKSRLKSFYKDLQNFFFMPTGFRDFDNINIGIPLDSLFVIGGQTGSGKTALALSLCINAKKKFGARVCFIPLEMSIEQMLLRLGSHLLRVPVNLIVKDLKKYYKPLVKAIAEFIGDTGEDGMSCFDFYSPDLDDMLPDILLYLQNKGYDIICCDYPKLLSSGNMKEHEALDKGAAFSKRWSAKNKCMVMHLNQLDGATEDIRYSRAIKEHASNAWFIGGGSDFIRENGYAPITQPKARNQSPHPFKLKADLACSYYGNFSEEVDNSDARLVKKKPKNIGSVGLDSTDVPDDD